MPGKQPPTVKTIPSKSTDDFLLIRGIGPALARQLLNADICTYRQLASLSPAEIASLVTGRSAKQIARQNWVGQARKLIRKKDRGNPHITEPAPIARQRYENFTLECLLDNESGMRRIRIVHVQSGDADTWAGMETEQLIGFLARHTGIQVQAAKASGQRKSGNHRKAVQKLNVETSPAMLKTSGPALAQPTGSRETLDVENWSPADVPQSPAILPHVADTLNLRDLKVMLAGSDTSVNFIRQGQAFFVRLTLDLTAFKITADAPITCDTTINYNQLGGGLHFISEASDTIMASNCVTMNIPGTNLISGIYRLDAIVKITNNDLPRSLNAFLKGELLQVY